MGKQPRFLSSFPYPSCEVRSPYTCTRLLITPISHLTEGLKHQGDCGLDVNCPPLAQNLQKVGLPGGSG